MKCTRAGCDRRPAIQREHHGLRVLCDRCSEKPPLVDYLHPPERVDVLEPDEAPDGLGDGQNRRGRLSPRRADVSRVRPFRWAWEHRVLLGYLNLIVGDEGVGKGTFLAWFISRVTRGELPGDLFGKPARVLVVGDEDGFDNVVVPRLIAAGADLDAVLELPADDHGPLNINRDADDLRELLEEEGISVVVFDQLLDNLGAGIDDWRSKQVREAIAPLRRLAAEIDVSVLAALHTNKDRTGSFRHRVAGTQAFNALSRSSLLLTQHPDDEERRVLVRGKGNYSRRPASMEFSIESMALDINGHRHQIGTLAGITEGEMTVEEALGQPRGDLTKADRGRLLIAEALDDGAWHPAADVLAQLAELEIPRREATRLTNDMGVEKKKSSGFPTHALWRLPSRGGTPLYPSSPSSPSEEHRGARRASEVDGQDENLLDLAERLEARHGRTAA